jgi:hypothetical protein
MGTYASALALGHYEAMVIAAALEEYADGHPDAVPPRVRQAFGGHALVTIVRYHDEEM